MQTALEPVRLEAGALKDLVVGQEVDLGARLPGLADHRQQSVFQRNHRQSLLVGVVVDAAVPVHLHVHVAGERVDHRGAHAVQAAAGLVRLVVEFSACVQGGEHHPLRGNALFMQFYRDAAAVVPNRAGAVRLQGHPHLAAEAGQMLVHRIVHDLVDQVV